MNKEILEKKEVSEEILNKVIRFAQNHLTFCIKDLFDAYPNNQQYQLRYAIQNLRIDEKIYMFGNKRGAYYSTSPNSQAEKEDVIEDKQTGYASKEVKELILIEAKKRNGNYFKRSELGLEEKYPIHVIIASIKQLSEEGELEVVGSRRWTEYRYSKGTQKETKQEKLNETTSKTDLEQQIFEFIIKTKVVTVPILVEQFNTQRYNIVPVLDNLIKKEEIYHEGNKKSSRYIYKNVPLNEIDKIMEELTEDRKIIAQIDDLSEFLYADEFSSIGIGFNKEDKFEIKFIHSGMIVNRKIFESMDLGLLELKELTQVKDG